jgi:hypothetical protein
MTQFISRRMTSWPTKSAAGNDHSHRWRRPGSQLRIEEAIEASHKADAIVYVLLIVIEDLGAGTAKAK